MTTTATVPPVTEVDPQTLRAWVAAGEAVVVDVREPDEHARERIAGAKLVPLSRFDPAEVPSPAGKKVVLHCRSGRRSAEAASRLLAAGRPEAVHLTGGIEAWKAAGLKTEVNAAAPRLPIMRQVQITAGMLVFLGTILAWAVSPWFLLLTGFVGAGLTFAGISGYCGMANILALMPWNRALAK